MTTRRLTAILAADVVGFSSMMEKDEEGTLAEIRTLQQDVFRPAVERHHGRVVKTTGDGFLVEFASPVEAVRCALGVQDAVAAGSLHLRIGVNLGDIIIEPDGDVYGDGVNIAARLEGIADPGGICISGAVFDQIEGKIDRQFENRGEQQVKNISRPVRVYALVGTTSSTPPVRRSAPPVPDRPSIAVLPFTNMSGEAGQEYFADGVVEDIITALSRVRWFFVIARNSSFTYKGKAVDIRQVGRELGVRYVLEGSIRKAANRVRITGQLIEAATGTHLWADRFDGSLEDIFELQDRITESVIGAIEPSLRLAEMERAWAKPTDSLDAYDLCLQAMHLHYRGTEKDVRAALPRLYKAMDLDPDYALPRGLASYVYGKIHHERWAEPEARQKALDLARKAVTLGYNDPHALRMAGHMLGYVGRDYEAALAAVDRALALNPNLASAFTSSGWVRVYVGDDTTALQHFHKAMRLSPLDPESYMSISGVATAYLHLGQHEDALTWSRRCIREYPHWSTSYRIQIAALVSLDRLEEARHAGQEYIARYPDYSISEHVRHSPVRSAATKEAMANALRVAGVPE